LTVFGAMAQAAREKIKNIFSVSIMAQKYIQTYLNIF
jgi:hypothetical protein